MIETNRIEAPVTKTVEVIEAYGRVFLSKEMFDRFENEVVDRQKDIMKAKENEEKIKEDQRITKDKELELVKEQKEWRERKKHYVDTSPEILEARKLLSDNELEIKKLQEANKILSKGIDSHVKEKTKEFCKKNPSHSIELAACRRKLLQSRYKLAEAQLYTRELSNFLANSLNKYSVGPFAMKKKKKKI